MTIANEKPAARGRGGNRHPLSVMDFILSHLALVGENYIAAMHRAYKAKLDELARERGRSSPYHHSSYHSFEVKVLQLVREGKIEFTEKEAVSDDARVHHLKWKPVRRFYRLKR